MSEWFYIFFFFKQKTAYEMLRSLVGSEMCIRDSTWAKVSGRSSTNFSILVVSKLYAYT